MPLGMEVGLGPGHIVLDGDPALHPPEWAGWIMTPPGMKVGRGPGNIVLDGDPAPPKRSQPPPLNFRLMSVVAKRSDGSRCHLSRR